MCTIESPKDDHYNYCLVKFNINSRSKTTGFCIKRTNHQLHHSTAYTLKHFYEFIKILVREIYFNATIRLDI